MQPACAAAVHACSTCEPCRRCLVQAVEERASALARITAAEETATQAFEEVGNMRDEVADLRDRLTKVGDCARCMRGHVHAAAGRC